jgi:hypothetical protein
MDLDPPADIFHASFVPSTEAAATIVAAPPETVQPLETVLAIF